MVSDSVFYGFPMCVHVHIVYVCVYMQECVSVCTCAYCVCVQEYVSECTCASHAFCLFFLSFSLFVLFWSVCFLPVCFLKRERRNRAVRVGR